MLMMVVSPSLTVSFNYKISWQINGLLDCPCARADGARWCRRPLLLPSQNPCLALLAVADLV